MQSSPLRAHSRLLVTTLAASVIALLSACLKPDPDTGVEDAADESSEVGDVPDDESTDAEIATEDGPDSPPDAADIPDGSGDVDPDGSGDAELDVPSDTDEGVNDCCDHSCVPASATPCGCESDRITDFTDLEDCTFCRCRRSTTTSPPRWECWMSSDCGPEPLPDIGNDGGGDP